MLGQTADVDSSTPELAQTPRPVGPTAGLGLLERGQPAPPHRLGPTSAARSPAGSGAESRLSEDFFICSLGVHDVHAL